LERALIVGASGGIGSAMATLLAARGAEVTRLSRSANGVDVTDEASIVRSFSTLVGPFDLIIAATGALVIDGQEPEKAITQITPEGFMNQIRLNALGPALILKHALSLLPGDRRAVFVALSARVGSIGDNAIGGWHSYRSAKAALNQLIHGAAIELRRTHKQVIVACLHPGTVATSFTAKYAGRYKAVAPEEAARNLLAVIDGLTSSDTGGFFDWAGEQVPW
jgi:NAD(P)-dependent dehydrogenase (short-subunit alcohol dehydrogenase family)